jgi:hypothetical protein
MLEVERYYRILELEPDASPEEVHQGYLDLTWVWHPDRFAGHPRLQQKAHYKLQELNEAHERLRSFQPPRRKRNLRPTSKWQTSPPAQAQSFPEGFCQPHVDGTWGIDDKQTIKDSRRHVSFNTRDVGEWLD